MKQPFNNKNLACTFLLAAILAMAACTPDNLDIPHAADYTTIYMPQAHEYPSRKNIFVVDTPLTFTYSAYFGGPSRPGEDVRVSFSVAPELADSFNLQNGTDYPMMPEGSYRLDDSVAVIPAKQLSTPLLKISIQTLGKIEVDKSYLLPVTITQLSGNYQVNEQLKTVFFLFTGGYAPGEEIHWSDFNAILPFGKYWIARKPNGGLWRYPMDDAGNFGPPKQVAEDWDRFDIIFNYGDSTVMARDPDGKLFSFHIDSEGNIGQAKQVGIGWGIFKTIIGYGDALVAINNLDATLWFYPVDAQGNIQPGREIGQGWAAVDPVIGSDGALIARMPGQLTRFPLDANGNFDYGNIRQIGSDWDAFDMIFYFDHALIARKPNGGLWRYPLDANGNLGSPVRIGE